MSNVLMASEGLVSGHANLTNNPHGVTKTQVGLGSVDNTSDVDKPVSTATANAIATAVKTAVKTSAQTLTDNEKSQARENIGAQAELPLMGDGTTYNIAAFTSSRSTFANAASKATNDGNGNVISETYAKSSELSSHTGNGGIHVTADQKAAWSAKQDAIAAFLKDAVVNGGVLTITKKDGTTVQFQGGSSAWADITGKPQSFTPSAHQHTKEQITDFPQSMNPNAHASSHAAGGADSITPSSIGAIGDAGTQTINPTIDGRNGKLIINGGDGGGSIEVNSQFPDDIPASIKKNGKEVATEELVESLSKYPRVQVSPSAIADRKRNDIGSVSSDFTITVPSPVVSGATRDFIVCASVTGAIMMSLSPTDAGGNAVSFQAADPTSLVPEEGDNVWWFSEKSDGAMLVSHLALKDIGHSVKVVLTPTNIGSDANFITMKDSSGNVIEKVTLKNTPVSKVVGGVSSIVVELANDDYSTFKLNGVGYKSGTVTITGDVAVTESHAYDCLTPETMISTPNGQVMLKDIKVGDVVLGIDPSSGKVCETRVTMCDSDMEKYGDARDVWVFELISGETIEFSTVKRHRFYNVERAEMVYMDEWKIGEHGWTEERGFAKLVRHECVHEKTRHMTLFTESQTYFADGMLSGNRHTKKITWKDGE